MVQRDAVKSLCGGGSSSYLLRGENGMACSRRMSMRPPRSRRCDETRTVRACGTFPLRGGSMGTVVGSSCSEQRWTPLALRYRCPHRDRDHGTDEENRRQRVPHRPAASRSGRSHQ
jgi:hypothetical protein